MSGGFVAEFSAAADKNGKNSDSHRSGSEDFLIVSVHVLLLVFFHVTHVTMVRTFFHH